MSETMKVYNTTFNEYSIPGCEKYKLLTDEYWECQARHYTMTIYHPVGTAKMGPDDDPDAVVDPRLRVRGKIMYIYSKEFNIIVDIFVNRCQESSRNRWFHYAFNNYRQYKCTNYYDR